MICVQLPLVHLLFHLPSIPPPPPFVKKWIRKLLARTARASQSFWPTIEAVLVGFECRFICRLFASSPPVLYTAESNSYCSCLPLLSKFDPVLFSWPISAETFSRKSWRFNYPVWFHQGYLVHRYCIILTEIGFFEFLSVTLFLFINFNRKPDTSLQILSLFEEFMLEFIVGLGYNQLSEHCYIVWWYRSRLAIPNVQSSKCFISTLVIDGQSCELFS